MTYQVLIETKEWGGECKHCLKVTKKRHIKICDECYKKYEE